MSGDPMDGLSQAPYRRRQVWVAAVAAAVLLATAIVGSALLAEERVAERPPFTPRPAPALSGVTLAGDSFDLADWRGQVVVVNVWASWCGPCRDEMPLLEDTSQRLTDRGLRVVGINTRDDPQAARTFLRETGATFPSIVDTDGTQAVSWGTVGMPETYLVDRSGQIVDKWFGEVTEEWIATTVDPLVEQS